MSSETGQIFFTYFVNFYIFTMFLVEAASKTKIKAVVSSLIEADLSKLTKRRYYFDWKTVFGKYEVFNSNITTSTLME